MEVATWMFNQYRRVSRKRRCFLEDYSLAHAGDLIPQGENFGKSFHEFLRPPGYPDNAAYKVDTSAEWDRFPANQSTFAARSVRTHGSLEYRRIVTHPQCDIPSFHADGTPPDSIHGVVSVPEELPANTMQSALAPGKVAF